jgi:hypothetical protein
MQWCLETTRAHAHGAVGGGAARQPHALLHRSIEVNAGLTSGICRVGRPPQQAPQLTREAPRSKHGVRSRPARRAARRFKSDQLARASERPPARRHSIAACSCVTRLPTCADRRRFKWPKGGRPSRELSVLAPRRVNKLRVGEGETWARGCALPRRLCALRAAWDLPNARTPNIGPQQQVRMFARNDGQPSAAQQHPENDLGAGVHSAPHQHATRPVAAHV